MGGAALVAVVRIVPVERCTAGRALAAEGRHETEAVAVLGGPGRESGEFEEGRIVIGADDRRVAGGAGLGDAGGGDDPGDAGAALVRPALAAAEGEVGRGMAFAGGEAAVVGHEDDDGAVGEAVFLEGGEDAAEAGVELFQHRGIGRMVLDEAHIAGALAAPRVRRGGELFLFVFCDEVGAGRDRRVRGEEGQIGEEGFVRVGVDEGHGGVGDAVGGLGVVARIGRRGGGFRIPELGVALGALAGGEAGAEALGVGGEFAAAEVPLAGEEGRVTAVAQRFGEGGLGEREVVGVGGGEEFAGAHAGDEIGDAEARRIFSGHDAAAGGRADAAGGVALGETQAAFREGINVRRFIERVRVVRADVHVAEVVGEDEDDVGARRRGGVGGRRGGDGEQEGKREGEKKTEWVHGIFRHGFDGEGGRERIST